MEEKWHYQKALRVLLIFSKTVFRTDPDEVFGNFGGDYPIEENLALKTQESDLDSMYPTNVAPKTSRFLSRESKVVSMPSNSYKSGEVTVIEPRSFSESAQIVRKLIEKKTVVLHLDLLDKEQSQRTIDFVCGASQALNGQPKKVGDGVFVFAPHNVTLSAAAQQNKFNDSLWRTSLQ